LASIPGMSDERAKELAAKGFRDFADVVRLALPERAVRQGLHHTIARRVLLADLVPRPQRSVSGARCPMCGAAWLANATRCASCGSAFGLELDPVAIERWLEEITGDLVNLAEDDDFQGMPEDVRNEILQAFGGVTRDDLLREEYAHQIEAWRTKGFDVAHVEHLLEADLPNFRKQSARLIPLRVGLWFSSALVAVASGVGLHEISHKIVAQRYGHWAEFRYSLRGLAMAFVFAFFGFLIGAPGATMVSGNVTRDQNGRISAAGPMSNLVIGTAFMLAAAAIVRSSSLTNLLAIFLTIILVNAWYLNVILAGFNMIPILPFD